MAFNLQHFDFFSARVDHEEVKGGTLYRSTNISVDGDVYEKVTTIANGANAAVYSLQLSSFNYLNIASDYNTRALISDNTGNTFNITLRGTGVSSKYGIPVALGSDLTLNTNHINSVTVFNESGNTAKVRITVVK